MAVRNPICQSMEGWNLGRGESRVTRQQLQKVSDLRAEDQAIVAEMRDEYMDARFHCGEFGICASATCSVATMGYPTRESG